MAGLMDSMTPGAGIDNTPGPDAAAQAQAPQVSPMTTPQPAQGHREEGLINVHMAMDLLQSSLDKFGAESEEGGHILKTLGALTKIFGGQRQQTDQLGNTEILQMLSKLPNAGGAGPEQKVAQGQPAVPGMDPGAQAAPPMGGMGMPQPGAMQ